MHGKTVRKVPEATMVEELKVEIDKIAQEYFEKQAAEKAEQEALEQQI
jgi:(E)-4-hydroxy-3-methylbut-2-enyl-diphosphate synthase